MPTFLHAADLHVDSPMQGLDTYEGAPADRMRGATRRALENMVTLAMDERVAFVVLAGDVYDTEPLLETSLFFRLQMQRLSDARIPVVIVRGNHDHAGIAPKNVRLPSGVDVLPHEKAETISPVPGVFVHGRSYPRPDYDRDLVDTYPAPIDGALNIGLLHTSLTGYPEHATYAPTSPAALAARGYQYWALGHVHRFNDVEHAGSRIVFPGNLQGRSVRETGAKGAVLVSWEGNAITNVVHRPLDVMRWHHVVVDTAEAIAAGDVRSEVGERVKRTTGSDRERGLLCAVRVSLVGTAPRAVGFDESDLREYLAGALQEAGGLLWLEKVHVRVETEVAGRSELEAQLKAIASERIASVEGRAALSRFLDGVRRDDLKSVDRKLLEELDLLPAIGVPLSEHDAERTLAGALALLAGELG